MNSSTRKIYDNILNAIYSTTHDYYEAYDRMIEFLTCDYNEYFLLKIPGSKWMFDKDSEIRKKIFENYNIGIHEEIANDKYDYLGEIYMDIQGCKEANRKGQYITPMHLCDLMVGMTMNLGNGPIRVLDPCIGTGRFAIAVSNINPDARIFGVDIDNRAIQTAICNSCIFKIHGFYLHADSLLHIIDIKYEEGRKNWRFANQWVSHFSEMVPESHRIRTENEIKTVEISALDDGLQLDVFK
ncbi:MAG: N-6 DNA methylase [Candidatus Neomarinimicrobiota bacterium]